MFSILIPTFQVLAGFLYDAQYLTPEKIEEILGVKETESIAPTQPDDKKGSDRVTSVELGKLADKIYVDTMKQIASEMEIDDPTTNHVLTDSEGVWLFNFSIMTLWTYKSTDNNREVTGVLFIIQKPSKNVVLKKRICPFFLIVQEKYFARISMNTVRIFPKLPAT